METDTLASANKELSISKLLNAPRELVWSVWTDPEHIKNWWARMASPIQLIKWILRQEVHGTW
jgi:uncharacterized protein YndB with AHSA1/START domain